MSRLTWAQPPDLVAHELVASAHEGRDVREIAARWVEAGGSTQAPASGLGQEGDDPLRALAAAVLDELDALPAEPDLGRREPTTLCAIEATWLPGPDPAGPSPRTALIDRVHGAWLGRAAGCLLGKPVEKTPRNGIHEILVSQQRWPLRTWFTAEDLPDEVAARWPWNRRSAPTSLVENIDGMPEDDDLNFCLVALSVLERCGPEFTSQDVADEWLTSLPAGRVFTAERVAYRNLLLGEAPPDTATLHNPFREWIGAQIRTDVYGWARPGDPAAAARMAYRDAVVSHVRNGVYGAMAVAAMCAKAMHSDDVDEVVAAGLAVVPPESRYAAALRRGVELGHSATDTEGCLDALYAEYGQLHWVHVLNNAALAAFALTRSRGDFEAAICTAVMGGWDTDSNGATVGSICGALTGAETLPAAWTEPLHNRLASSLPGFDGIGFDVLTARVVAVMQS
jgi:ADP-ribosylglycohydrolase